MFCTVQQDSEVLVGLQLFWGICCSRCGDAY